jgi:hypothetical protein
VAPREPRQPASRTETKERVLLRKSLGRKTVRAAGPVRLADRLGTPVGRGVFVVCAVHDARALLE